ncbi:Ribosomal_large subunit pseudouridine synthase D [Hexamita inflata]|uniref:Ribosomal large subunit pseudouridine synthase D n=1 Tax=Hexamita inflata TaxID=28002 RepID=A0AA86PCF2_9EUKA|nr:Ribosomal large subunit pseudouridine synthase D [Hexamita inflata]
MEPEIIFENQFYIAINKPYNYHIDGDYENTVEKFVENYIKIRPKLVHQLDYATSGVMLLGLNKRAAGKAAKQFQMRKTKKYYIAVVKGQINNKQIIDKAIMDDETDIKGFKMKIDEKGLEAQTEVTPLQYNQEKDQTLLLLKPRTGRRHQLRLHLLSIGHPIIGDMTYNNDNFYQDFQSRLMLHAFQLWNEPVGQVLFASCDFINDFGIEEQTIQKMCEL